MLTRIGEGLYWMGRFVKRSEYLTRYLRVQYFSTLDANMLQGKDFTLRSIMNMAGIPYDINEEVSEEQVLVAVGFDPENPNSIFSIVRNARENARNVRHIISTELWESINKYYLFVKDYPHEQYKTKGLYDFTTKAEEHVKVIQSNIFSTLIRNDEYYFISTGLFLENAMQVNRILRSKLVDVEILSRKGEITPIRQYQWITTLRALEALDMHNKHHKNNINIRTLSEFLIRNGSFPRSLNSILKNLLKSIKSIEVVPEGFKNLEYHVAKLGALARFYEGNSVKELNEFLNKTRPEIDAIHDISQSIYFENKKQLNINA